MAPRHLRQHLAHPPPHPHLPDPPPDQSHHPPPSSIHHSLPSQTLPHHLLPPADLPSPCLNLHPAPSPPQLPPPPPQPENAESSADSVWEPGAREPVQQPPSASGAAITTPVDLPPCSNGRGSVSSLPCDHQVEELLQPCLTAAESRAAKLLQQTMDTVQSQILCALQRAALDIIEHIGKDAVTRVVVAERKAAVVQQELSNVKQQAYSMLLRLKGDMDAQILEAENKTLFERKRAQEAEAKLSAVQDTSKRLKSELRKKGEILEKMQKLVQPDGEYADKSSRLEEAIERRRFGSRAKGSEVHSKAQQPEGQSKMLCSTDNVKDFRSVKNGFPTVSSNGMNMQKTLPVALRPSDEAEHTAEMKLDRRWPSSTAETSSSAKGGVRSQMHSLSAIQETTSGCLDSEEGPGILAEMHAAGGSLICNRQDEKTNHHALSRKSGQDKVLSVSRAENYDKQVDGVQQAQAPEFALCSKACQKLVTEDLTRGPALDGIRTGKVPDHVKNNVIIEERIPTFSPNLLGKDEGIVPEEQQELLSRECMSNSFCSDRFGMQSFEANGDTHETFINPFQLKGKPDIPEERLKALDSKENTSTYMIDQTTSRCSARDPAATMVLPCNGEGCKKDEQEVCSDCHKKDVASSACMQDDHEPVEPSESVRPDYEVATSLAEMAVTAKESEEMSPEVLSFDVGKQAKDTKPGKLGLKMKRKGAVLEQKDGSVLSTSQRKRPRVANGQTDISDSLTERSSRRPRLSKAAFSRDNLAVESSRDSRRLMQGARQV